MYILYIFLAIVILLFMVLIHEFGHYCIGRMLNFKITEFSIGFGKSIISRKNKRGELISLRIFPLGGYCAFVGEDEIDGNKKDAFTNQRPWKRILVFLAGVTFNFATAVLFSLILLCTVGYDIPQVADKFEDIFSNNSEIVNVFGEKIDRTQIVDGKYGKYVTYLTDDMDVLQPNDVIISINGKKIDFAYGYNYSDLRTEEFNNIINYMNIQKNISEEKKEVFDAEEAFKNYQPTTIATVKRNNEYKDVYLGFYQLKTLTMVTNENGEQEEKVVYQYCFDSNVKAYVHSFGEALERAVPFSIGLAWVVLKSFWLLITFQLPISAIGGPITTITTIATYTQASASNLLVLIPLFSANLAVFNALPIPALDGAHVLFTTIEAIRKKPIKRETENLIHTIGLLILFGAVILIDILHFLL